MKDDRKTIKDGDDTMEEKNPVTEAEETSVPETDGASAPEKEKKARPKGTADTKKLRSSLDAAEKKLADAEAKIEELNDRYLRVLAEYDNFRKRTAKERLELTDNVKASTVSEILPLIDNFERALAVECADEGFKKGIEMLSKQFSDALGKLGVKAMELDGTEFDPNLATAVSTVENEELGENTVAQVLQNGYTIGDKVIRPAVVVVANP